LELDPSATTADIKKQFKKLAVAFHPDKNPNCGKPCEEKISKINKAYEILSDEEKRRAFDQVTGDIAPIRSKTISLTSYNFERLVIDSNDIWIIQIYIDGDEVCEEFAGFWDEAALEYGHTVKFGRINAHQEARTLRYLPYGIQLFPTVISWVNGQDSEIYTPEGYNQVRGLKKFIEQVIGTPIHLVDVDQFLKLHAQGKSNNSSPVYRKPDVMHVTSSARLPIDYTYAGFKYEPWMTLYANTFSSFHGVSQNIRKKQNTDFLLYYDALNPQTKEFSRRTLFFDFKKSAKKLEYQNIVKLAKFVQIPELHRHSFEEFCHRLGAREISKDSEASQDESNSAPTLCVILMNDKKELEQVAYESITKSVSDMVIRVEEMKPAFGSSFESVQIVKADLSKHRKFRKVMTQVSEKYNQPVNIMALISPTNKIAVFDNTGTPVLSILSTS
jgi:hypothetical protein